MRIPRLLPLLLTPTLALSSTLPSTATIWAWPLSSPSPAPLATIAYDPLTLNTSTTAYTPPTVPESLLQPNQDKPIIRIGLYDPKSGLSSWSGTATSLLSFDPTAQHVLSLHLSRTGTPLSASFAGFKPPLDAREERRAAKRAERQKQREADAVAKGKTPKSKAGRSKRRGEREREQPIVEVSVMKSGLKPALERVVLDPNTGRVEGEVEKTFLQKYWWAIALFLVVQLAAGGARGEEGGEK